MAMAVAAAAAVVAMWTTKPSSKWTLCSATSVDMRAGRSRSGSGSGDEGGGHLCRVGLRLDIELFLQMFFCFLCLFSVFCLEFLISASD